MPQAPPRILHLAGTRLARPPGATSGRGLEALARRTMKLQCTIQEAHVLATSDDGSIAFDLERLREGR